MPFGHVCERMCVCQCVWLCVYVHVRVDIQHAGGCARLLNSQPSHPLRAAHHAIAASAAAGTKCSQGACTSGDLLASVHATQLGSPTQTPEAPQPRARHKHKRIHIHIYTYIYTRPPHCCRRSRNYSHSRSRSRQWSLLRRQQNH